MNPLAWVGLVVVLWVGYLLAPRLTSAVVALLILNAVGVV